MRILGIDPGLAIVGWSVIEKNGSSFKAIAYGQITTPAKTEVDYRLELIFKAINELIEKFNPKEMAIEELFFNTNVTTGIAVSEARGVILLAARLKGLTISEYTPLQIKQAVVGYGRAEKRQVIAMVTSLLRLPEPPKPDDTADAIAVALCHAQSSNSLITKYQK